MNHTSLSRREFLRLSAAGLTGLAGARLLSACGAAPTVLPTATSSPTATSAPIATSTTAPTAVPTVNPSRAALPALMRFFPVAPSTVVRTHHTGVWSDKTLVPGALRQMLDASITRLTGLNGARDAWAALFKPGERILIKVNTFSNSLIWTHVPLVQAVTDSLVAAGIPADHITIFDYTSGELTTGGFTINTDNPGVRCTGMDGNYSASTTPVGTSKVKLANILKDSDALINIPILKSHMLAGVTFAMKNHYGSFSFPDLLHGNDMRGVAALNALPEIKDRTRLIVGDALSANLHYASYYPYWKEDWVGDSIFMSFDPVAHDTLGLKLLTSELEKAGDDPTALVEMATPALKYAVELGLGTNDPANMQVIEQTLS